MASAKKNRPVVVGLFIIIGLAILVTAVFTLGGQKKSFVKGFTVNTIFNDVNGLLQGSNVWLSGVKIGTVKKIVFLPDSRVQVTMVIQRSLQPNIHKDALAKIGSDGLIGNKIVVITSGTIAAPVIKDGDYLGIQNIISTDDMLNTLQANNKNLLAITSSFARVSRNIDSGNGVIATLVNNDEAARKLNASLGSLQAIMNNFQSASARSRDVLANLNDFTARLNTPGSSINQLTTDTSLYPMLRGTVTQLRDISITAGQMTNNLKGATDRLSDTSNIPGVILNDPQAAASLKQTLINLQSSSAKLDEDLEAVQHNFLLRGYFRKKEKEKLK